MASKSLPRLFTMRSPSKGPYLTVREFPPPYRPIGLLKYTEPTIWSALVKFAAEPSKGSDTTPLVHIRSCYNNKYWVAKESQGQLWIAASADKPEEDRGNPACTLFSAVSVPTGGFKLLCVGRSMLVSYMTGDGGGMYLSTSGETFDTVSLEDLVVLPRRVAFQHAETGKFLSSQKIQGWPYHKFESGLDFADPLVANQLFPTDDGLYRIKDNHFGMYWRRSPNWIFANATDDDYSNDALFSFLKLSEGVFALRNLGNNYFCGGLTTEGKTNCLNAHYPTLTPETKLKVIARYVSSEISDVRYSLSNSRIYQQEILQVQNSVATNDMDKEAKVTVKFSVSESSTNSWTNSLSVNVGVVVKFNVATVPMIAEGGIEIKTDFGYTYEWGESTTKTLTSELNYEVPVPPSSEVKVTLMCTRAVCDVPFSYMETEVTTAGERISEFKNDGIFTGANSYNFHVVSDN